MNKLIFDVVHKSAKGLHEADLMDVKTMHTFDAMCLSPVHKLSPRQIKSIRLPERVNQSQAIQRLKNRKQAKSIP